jgi:hydrogenase-4 component E
VTPAPHYDFVHAAAALIAIATLLTELALLGAKLVHEQVRSYALQSLLAAAFALLVGVHQGQADLIVLAALTAAIKVVLVPWGINRQITFAAAEHEVPLLIKVPMSLLIGVALTGVAYWSATAIGARGVLLPDPVLGMPIALVLVGFFFMISRQNVISQIIGLLSLENGIFFATVTLAPGMPFVIGFLILFDVGAAVVFYAVLARLIVARMRQTSVLDMSTLRG